MAWERGFHTALYKNVGERRPGTGCKCMPAYSVCACAMKQRPRVACRTHDHEINLLLIFETKNFVLPVLPSLGPLALKMTSNVANANKRSHHSIGQVKKMITGFNAYLNCNNPTQNCKKTVLFIVYTYVWLKLERSTSDPTTANVSQRLWTPNVPATWWPSMVVLIYGPPYTI